MSLVCAREWRFVHTSEFFVNNNLSLTMDVNLLMRRFVECQEDRHRPLILSEFTGSYSYAGFRSCIVVNPWDSKNTAEAIHQALTMSDKEATARWKVCLDTIFHGDYRRK